jgi:hypothetical protein
VPEALGKAWKTLGIGFAECRTRQRGLDEQYIGKAFFAEYFFGHSAQTLPSARQYSAKKSHCHGARVTETASLPSVCRLALGKESISGSLCQLLCRVLSMALGKACLFVECQVHDTRQRSYTGAQVLVLCRVL